MQKFVVAIPDGMHNDGILYLEQRGIGVMPKEESKKRGIENLLREADAVVARSATKVNKLPYDCRVKIFGRAGSGVDNFKGAWDEIIERCIPIVNSPEPNAISVAELVFGYLLHHAKKLDEVFKASREGRWIKPDYKGEWLYGKTLGVIGVGFIGKEVVKRARAFGMHVLAYDTTQQQADAKFVSLEELLMKSDFVTVHIPFTGSSVITAEHFNMVKEGAVFINTSRGGVVDESALVEALKSNKIKCYVDVFSTEPFDGSKGKPSQALTELLSQQNAYCTHHIGASTREGQRENSMIIARKIANYLLYGFLESACNMDINPDLAYLRGVFHKLGMLSAQYAGKGIKEISILLNGELMKSNEAVRKQLKESYLCGLLSQGDIINPLKLQHIGGIECRINNADEYNADIVKVELERDGSRYVFEANYNKSEVGGLGHTENGKMIFYRTNAPLAGNIVFAEHADVPGALAVITDFIAKSNININNSRLSTDGGQNLTVIESSKPLKPDALQEFINNSPYSKYGRKIEFYRATSIGLPPAGAF
jgi:D-3-phosphoglycerate dehydrogenase